MRDLLFYFYCAAKIDQNENDRSPFTASPDKVFMMGMHYCDCEEFTLQDEPSHASIPTHHKEEAQSSCVFFGNVLKIGKKRKHPENADISLCWLRTKARKDSF